MHRDERLWVMIDVETSGPIYGRHSMTELGAAVGSRKRGLVDEIELLIAPISDEVVTSKGSFARARERGVAPGEAMARFASWLEPYEEQRAELVARPAAFDWPWIV